MVGENRRNSVASFFGGSGSEFLRPMSGISQCYRILLHHRSIFQVLVHIDPKQVQVTIQFFVMHGDVMKTR